MAGGGGGGEDGGGVVRRVNLVQIPIAMTNEVSHHVTLSENNKTPYSACNGALSQTTALFINTL